MRKLGFTLFEILISLTILMVLYLSINSFSLKYKKVELETIVCELNSALRFAKFYALINSKDVAVVCLENNNCTYGLKVITGKSQLVHEFSWPRNNNQIIWLGFQNNRGPIFTNKLLSGVANGRYVIKFGDNFFKELLINRIGKISIKG